MKKLFLLSLAPCLALGQSVPLELEWGTYFPVHDYPNIHGHSYNASHNQNFFYYGQEDEVLNQLPDGTLVIGARLRKVNPDLTSPVEQTFISPNALKSEIEKTDFKIVLLNPDGTLKYGTYFGGEEDDVIAPLVMGEGNNFYIWGDTKSTQNIATPGGHLENFTNAEYSGTFYNPIYGYSGNLGLSEEKATNGFITKMDSDGNILWSTYISGNKGASITHLKKGPDGIYLLGISASDNADFTTEGVFASNPPATYYSPFGHFFVCKYSFDGELLWRSYLPAHLNSSPLDGYRDDSLFYPNSKDIRFDEQGNFITMYTTYSESGIPGNSTMVPVLISSDGQQCTIYNAPNTVSTPPLPPGVVSVGSPKSLNGNRYFLGSATSSAVGTEGSFRPTIPPNSLSNNYFLMKFNQNDQLQWATFLPFKSAIELDQNENIYILSNSQETDLATEDALLESVEGSPKTSLMKMTPEGNVLWSTYLDKYHSLEETEIVIGQDGERVFILQPISYSAFINENGLYNTSEYYNYYNEDHVRLQLYCFKPKERASVDAQTKNNFTIYPNPANEKIFIQSNEYNSLENTTYSIYDINGKLIRKNKLNSDGSIPIEQLSSGIYILELENAAGKSSNKFVKK